LALVLAFGECPGSKKADEVILTGCTISQIERKAEMSAQGQTRKSVDAITTSALPPTADIPESGCDVRKVPRADIPQSSLLAMMRICGLVNRKFTL
jgi:hypothetical protein